MSVVVVVVVVDKAPTVGDVVGLTVVVRMNSSCGS